MLSIIVAIAKNNAIGKDNELLWHISEDLKYFKKTTLGYPIIMGRNTWESLPFKPLPNRDNIIITNNKDYKANGGIVFHEIQEVLDYSKNLENSFIIGGGQIYQTFLPHADKLYITEVDKDFQADTFFPIIDLNIWEIESQSETNYDGKEDLYFTYKVFRKKRNI